MRTYIKILFIGCLVSTLVTSITDAEVLKSYRFSDKSDVDAWNTSWKWGAIDSRGTATWSSEYGGTAKLSISGAPCAIDFWKRLPCDLVFGDYLIVKFHCKAPLDPIGHFDMIIGPTEPHGHKQSISVNTTTSGSFRVRMPIYISKFIRGTPFGIRFSVWPGSLRIYIKEILLVRED